MRTLCSTLATIIALCCTPIGIRAEEGGSSAALARLAILVGEWEVDGTVLDVTGKPVEVQTEATLATRLDGACVEERGVYPLPSQRVEFICTRSWDQFQSQYRMSCIDNLSGLLDVYEGDLKDGRLVMTNLSSGTYAEANGVRMYGRNTTYDISPDHFRVKWEMSFDQGTSWSPYGELEYRRKQAPAPEPR